MRRRYNHCARLSTPLLDKATVAERGHATDPRPPSGETQGRLAAEESFSFTLLHADRVAGAGSVWIERTGKSPFFSPRARQCISFHAAVPENALCPGISWGALPHGPQTRLGQHCPAFLPPVPGAIAAGIPPHEAARSSSASSTWPGRRHLAHVAHALSPRPGAEPRTEQTLRERRRKERACVCRGWEWGAEVTEGPCPNPAPSSEWSVSPLPKGRSQHLRHGCCSTERLEHQTQCLAH